MNKYTKPTISLLPLSSSSAAASSCSTSKGDLQQLREILASMGYNFDNAFGMGESCKEPILFEAYCKFTSAIQVFGS